MSIELLDNLTIKQLNLILDNLETRLETVREKFLSSVITTEEYENVVKDLTMQQVVHLKAKVKKMEALEKTLVDTVCKMHDMVCHNPNEEMSDEEWEGNYVSEEKMYNL